MILKNINKLILEDLEQLSTFERIFRYGPIDTLALAISRALNHEVYQYFEVFLIDLDDTIMLFNSTAYKVNINRIDVGELYNIARNNVSRFEDSDYMETFLIKYFDLLNSIMLEIAKKSIDELYDNDVKMNNISSLAALLTIKSNSKLYFAFSKVLSDYQDLLKNKPTTWYNIISRLKRIRIHTEFTVQIITKLEKLIIEYIKSKMVMNIDRSSIINLLTAPQ